MKHLIKTMCIGMMLATLIFPAFANQVQPIDRGVLISNDETGIADKNLYEFIKNITKQDKVFTKDLAHLQELTITNYEYDIKSLQGLQLLELPKLSTMNIAVNTLTDIEPILHFEQIEELNLYHLNITTLPVGIAKLLRLSKLRIEGGAFARFPASFYDMVNLKSLILKNVPLADLGQSFAQLVSLENLTLQQTQMRSIPKEITKLVSLTVLECSGMGLAAVPNELSDMTKLQRLSLEDNSFTKIPDIIYNMYALKYISFKQNQLQMIGKNIEQLTRMEELILANNQLRTLPLEITNLQHLRKLDISNNTFDCLPSDMQYLQLDGIDDIFQYYNIAQCGVLSTSMSQTLYPIPSLAAEGGMTQGAYINEAVVITSDQPVYFIVNGMMQTELSEEIILNLDGKYTVSAKNEERTSSNTLSFTIDAIAPKITIQADYNPLSVYVRDVAIEASEDGYFIVNGSKQSKMTRLLVVSVADNYEVSFVDYAGNSSNILTFSIERIGNPVTEKKPKFNVQSVSIFLLVCITFGFGTYLFLKKGVTDEEDA